MPKHRRDPHAIRVAAVGDLHFGKAAKGTYGQLFAQIAQSADVLVLCGDLTDHGLPEEAEILASDFSTSPAGRLPTVAVLGNHDFHSDKQEEVSKILTQAGMQILDGDAKEVAGIGFAGVKGFAGGFGRGTLGHWGEKAIKVFVEEAIAEAMKLEGALARLRTTHRIAVLHYSPIKATVENEPVEIFPFLGCSRLEEPLNRYPVTAVFHGHAHKGSPEGKTTTGTPVYNVSLPLMRAHYPNRPPIRILEVPAGTVTEVTPSPAEQPPVETAVH